MVFVAESVLGEEEMASLVTGLYIVGIVGNPDKEDKEKRHGPVQVRRLT